LIYRSNLAHHAFLGGEERKEILLGMIHPRRKKETKKEPTEGLNVGRSHTSAKRKRESGAGKKKKFYSGWSLSANEN